MHIHVSINVHINVEGCVGRDGDGDLDVMFILMIRAGLQWP